MIKTKINNEYKDIIKIFGGDTLQKEITKVWSREANKYVYESSVEYTGALPITITADGNALIDYKIYGNTVQDGTPTPENPVDVVGCGVRTENLLDYATIESTQYATAILISGGINISGRYFVRFRTVEFVVGRSYTMSWTAKAISGTVAPVWRLQFSDNTYSSVLGSGGSIVVEKEVIGLLLYVNMTYTSGVVEITNIMLNLGSTALPYEPYGYKLPILSNSTVTNIYLGESQTTRRIKKLVFDGTEDWYATSSTGVYYTNKSASLNPVYFLGICDRFVYSLEDKIYNLKHGEYLIDQANKFTWIRNNDIARLQDLKDWLAQQYAAGTPVTVWYVLAEPETGVVNEPLMKIGDYADTVSMEQAGVQIPTFAGTTVIDYDGTPKPGKMYVKYRR